MREETLAEHEVCVWQVGEGLEENLHDDLQVAVGGVELVQLQEGQVGLQIIRLLPGLKNELGQISKEGDGGHRPQTQHFTSPAGPRNAQES